MRKKLKLALFTIILSSLCIFNIGCSQKRQENNSSIEVTGNSVFSKNEQAQTSIDDFTVKNLYIKDHPLMSDTLFTAVTINDILRKDPSLKRENIGDSKNPNGYIIHWISSGIIYVSHSENEQAINAIILTDETYSLNNGLKIGMTEYEISSLGIDFKTYFSNDINEGKNINSVGSQMLEQGPITIEEFDTCYTYIYNIPEEEMNNANLSTSAVSVSALIKNVYHKCLYGFTNCRIK